MHLQKTKRTGKAFNASLSWNKADIERLIRLYPESHDKDLSVVFGRSQDAVRAMARRLGLKKDYAGGYTPIYSLGTHWTTDEISQLKRLFPTTSNHDIAELMGRSFPSICCMTQILKLKKIELWTQEDNEFLKEQYQKLHYAALARRLKKTEGAVMSQIHRLGLKNKVKLWTGDDLEILKKNYHKVGGIEVARMLGRSHAAIRRKASLLSMGGNKSWSEEENKTLRELYNNGKLEEITEKLGRTFCAVKRHAQVLGLRRVAS